MRAATSRGESSKGGSARWRSIAQKQHAHQLLAADFLHRLFQIDSHRGLRAGGFTRKRIHRGQRIGKIERADLDFFGQLL